MPVRPEIIRRKLLDIGEPVGRLRAWLPITIERLEQDVMLRWAGEHGLHLSAESLFDVGAHSTTSRTFVADVESWLARAGR